MRKPQKQSGFTLLEVLIAVVILGIGLTGMAGLQIVSLRNSQQAYQRTQATLLAYDVADRMRVNRDAAENGDYDTNFGDDVTGLALCFGIASNCTPAQLAGHDRRQWRQSVTNFLPAGSGSIATAVVAGQTQATVAVRWIDPNVIDNNGNPVPQVVNVVVAL